VQGRSFAWELRNPGLRVIGDHAVESRDGGSRVTLSVRFEGVLGGLMGAILKNLNQQYLRLEAEGLKRRAEGETGWRETVLNRISSV
jgi:hypothetical protein